MFEMGQRVRISRGYPLGFEAQEEDRIWWGKEGVVERPVGPYTTYLGVRLDSGDYILAHPDELERA